MKYPWEEWFARDEVILVSGVDYAVPSYAMMQSVRTQARRRGIKVGISVDQVTVDGHTREFLVLTPGCSARRGRRPGTLKEET
jgi:hypothetical protein